MTGATAVRAKSATVSRSAAYSSSSVRSIRAQSAPPDGRVVVGFDPMRGGRLRTECGVDASWSDRSPSVRRMVGLDHGLRDRPRSETSCPFSRAHVRIAAVASRLGRAGAAGASDVLLRWPRARRAPVRRAAATNVASESRSRAALSSERSISYARPVERERDGTGRLGAVEVVDESHVHLLSHCHIRFDRSQRSVADSAASIQERQISAPGIVAVTAWRVPRCTPTPTRGARPGDREWRSGHDLNPVARGQLGEERARRRRGQVDAPVRLLAHRP
jgi:hypothetical protein